MRASAYPKLLPAMVGAALLAAAAPAVAAPAPAEDTTTCGAVAHIGDGLSHSSADDLTSAYEKIGIPADGIHIDAADGRGVLSAKDGDAPGVEVITKLVQDTETEPPIDGGRCWVIAVGGDDLEGEANPDDMVRDVLEAVPHDERVMWINVDSEGDAAKAFNDALGKMEGEYAQTKVADWAGADGSDDAGKFGAFAAAELLDMTRPAGAVDPAPASGYKTPAPKKAEQDKPKGDAPKTSESKAPATPVKDTPAEQPKETTTPPAPKKDDKPAETPKQSTTPAAPKKDDKPAAAPKSEAPAAPPAPADKPASPPAPKEDPKPAGSNAAPAEDLKASFDSLQKSVNGTLGIAIAPVDGDATAFGELTSEVAWSTSKVPIAIAALRNGSANDSQVTAAITQSDNDAAKALWASLGGEAKQKTEAVLTEGGDRTTKVQDQAVRPEFTPFGQTKWSMADAAKFGAGLSKMDDDAANKVKGHMGNIASGQDYGLGKIPGAQYKGGWGPNESGGYLVRQFGIIDLDGAKVGVAIGVKTSTGGYEAASPALSTAAKWIQDNKAALAGKKADAPAPAGLDLEPVANNTAPAAQQSPRTEPTKGGGLDGKTIWIDAGHAAKTRPGETITDPKTGAVKECYTSGTASNDGWQEHTFNWEFTQALKAELEARGATVELGRDDDTGTYECHDKRVAEENESAADLVISVHADGADAGNRGFHIIHSDTPTPGSKEAAVAARDSLVEAGFTTSNYLGADGVDARGDLYGLNNTTKAKILLEMGNMKDSTDLALLKDPEQQKKMASAIADSLTA